MGDTKNMENETEEEPRGDNTDREEEGPEGVAIDTENEPKRDCH